MNFIQEIIDLGNRVAEARGVTLSTVGNWVANDGGFFDDIINSGRDLQISTYTKVKAKLESQLEQSGGCGE